AMVLPTMPAVCANAKRRRSRKGLSCAPSSYAINPATKYVALSASNRTRIKARLAGNGKPLSKAATQIRVLFEAPNELIIK
ncbi:hypothetical protein, partial [Thiolapillus sp.]